MKRYTFILRGFSIIEVMIGIFVFTLGLTSIYMLLISSLNVNEYNKNAIIASNLAREQIELVRNIRDTNYSKLKVWRQMNPSASYDSLKLFKTNTYYILENDVSASPIFSTKVDTLISVVEGESNISSMDNYRLCITNNGRYTYDCGGTNTPTHFYRYLYIDDVEDGYGDILSEKDAFRVTSKVIWYKKGYHEYDIKTVIADWRRI